METSTKVLGASAEERATVALEAAGYAIVVRNWTCAVGELDVVARDGDILVFVEVRSRANTSHGHAAEMVTASKRAKVTRVAQMYLGLERPVFAECRFDVIAITGGELAIVKDAWRLG